MSCLQLDRLDGTADRLQPNDKLPLICTSQQMTCLKLDILDGTADRLRLGARMHLICKRQQLTCLQPEIFDGVAHAGKLQPGDRMPWICKTVDMHKTVDDLPAA